ncbi:helix-turn-helix domain-containing protein [Streptomyces malaysiensis subsp. malaysiensis]|uniref:Helix-turn-helix domain-containing protein n=3 Tax=Streptomyces TaxID=1883 RepID=A0ABX6W2F9_STRMQ|nr:helix-turn-helix domain-containing protein [Streptomyces solisilvae]
MKTPPTYAIASIDHALRLATMLQLEGSLRVAEAAERLGVAQSTANRLLQMLVYRDFAVQDETRVYRAGPVLELAAHSLSRTALLRSVALPHMRGLVDAVEESSLRPRPAPGSGRDTEPGGRRDPSRAHARPSVTTGPPRRPRSSWRSPPRQSAGTGPAATTSRSSRTVADTSGVCSVAGGSGMGGDGVPGQPRTR